MKALSFILLNHGLQIFLKARIGCRAEKYTVVNWQIKTHKSLKFIFCIAQVFSSIIDILTHGVFKIQWENETHSKYPHTPFDSGGNTRRDCKMESQYMEKLQ